MATFSHTYAGPINLVQATWQSDNTVYAQLALDLGPAKIVAVAHQMGIQSHLTAWPSIVLGTEVVDPLEVADAYATLASEGIHHAPQAIAKVVFPDGHVARAKVRRQARHPGWRGLRRRRDPAGQHPLRHGRRHAQLLHGHRGRQDRHDLELGRRLVLRL